jgi:starch-binding outer membrane protein, SusD/RagB family
MNVAAPSKGITWSPNWSLFPIPVYDLIENPNLIQNPGY